MQPVEKKEMNNQQNENKSNNIQQSSSIFSDQYQNKIYIPTPQNRQVVQNINNIEKQCNIYQLISPTYQESEKSCKLQQPLDFLQTLLFLSKNVSIDSQSTCSTQINQNQQATTKTKKHHCNCKKTKCLKLYCECFVNNEECDSSCNCMECCNTQTYSEERKQAIESILERNANQQQSRFKNVLNAQPKNYQRGCNCKKSGCQKKYCECYNAGVPCSEYCKCEGCQNCLTYKKVKKDFEIGSIQPFNEELQSQQSQQSKTVNSDLHEKLLQFLQYADQLEVNQSI